MARVTRYLPEVPAALALLPPAIRGLLQFRVWTEDPVFCGLHDWTTTADGRSYRDTAHVLCPEHYGQRTGQVVPVVVLVGTIHVMDVVHELGHVLDHQLGHRHAAEPVSEYAQTNRREAFAEALCSWLWLPEYADAGIPPDPATVALFEGLL